MARGREGARGSGGAPGGSGGGRAAAGRPLHDERVARDTGGRDHRAARAGGHGRRRRGRPCPRDRATQVPRHGGGCGSVARPRPATTAPGTRRLIGGLATGGRQAGGCVAGPARDAGVEDGAEPWPAVRHCAPAEGQQRAARRPRHRLAASLRSGASAFQITPPARSARMASAMGVTAAGAAPSPRCSSPQPPRAALPRGRRRRLEGEARSDPRGVEGTADGWSAAAVACCIRGRAPSAAARRRPSRRASGGRRRPRRPSIGFVEPSRHRVTRRLLEMAGA